MTESRLGDLVQLHKALASPMRLRILALLCGGPLYECEIAAALDAAPSSVSEQLTCLRRVGLVSERREGRWVEVRQTLTDDQLHELACIQRLDRGALTSARRGHARRTRDGCGREEAPRDRGTPGEGQEGS